MVLYIVVCQGALLRFDLNQPRRHIIFCESLEDINVLLKTCAPRLKIRVADWSSSEVTKKHEE